MIKSVVLEPILEDSVVVTPLTPDQLIELVKSSFTEAKFPGVQNLSRGYQTDEPEAVKREFWNKQDWRTLEPDFIDRAPKGLASALSFFSDAAFRFYLPAYMIADVQHLFRRVDLPFYLVHYFTDKVFFSTGEKDKWMLNDKLNRCSFFTSNEVRAIIAYLEYVAYADDAYYEHDREDAKQALNNYWYARESGAFK